MNIPNFTKGKAILSTLDQKELVTAAVDFYTRYGEGRFREVERGDVRDRIESTLKINALELQFEETGVVQINQIEK